MTKITKTINDDVFPQFILCATHVFFKLLIPLTLFMAVIALLLNRFEPFILNEINFLLSLVSQPRGGNFTYLAYLIILLFFVCFAPVIAISFSYSNLTLSKQWSRARYIYSDKSYYPKALFLCLLGLSYWFIIFCLFFLQYYGSFSQNILLLIKGITFLLFFLKSYYLVFIINFHWAFACQRKSLKVSWQESVMVIKRSWFYLLFLVHAALVLLTKLIILTLSQYFHWLLSLIKLDTSKISIFPLIFPLMLILIAFVICLLFAIIHVARIRLSIKKT